MVKLDAKELIEILNKFETSEAKHSCDLCEDDGYVFDQNTRKITACTCTAKKNNTELQSWKAEQKSALKKTISQRIDIDKTKLPSFPLPSGGAWLYGKAGTGKTHLAAYMLANLIDAAEKKVSWCFHPVRSLLDAWVQQYSEYSEIRTAALALMSQLSACKLVVLDDIDKISRITPAREEELYSLFDTLHSRNATLIVTSQISIDEFCRRMPHEAEYIRRDGIGPQQRRLKEMCKEIKL